MADALSELSGPTNPDAQATITDFHDYTEFFPSDLARSLTLIGKLNGEYAENAQQIHNLTKTYGALPSIPAAERPDALSIRRQVSQHLQHALRARAATVAEATRLCDVADTLYSRLDGIKKKLAAVPKPPSREPSPKNVKTRSPQASRSRKSDADRTKLTLNPPAAATTANKMATAAAKEKKRSRRIIVPGEVLPPFDPNSPLGSDVSSEDDEIPPPPSPVRIPASLLRANDSLMNSATKTPKILKTPKTPKIRPPGVMGTNVHSTVAGISVSNAMASLTPPPPDAVPGSEWQPWLSLTEWELNLLRRRMKKNANWRPSETMTRRELKERNRGPDAFAKAKAEAEARGETVLDEPAHKFSDRGDELRPVQVTEVGSTTPALNVGMKLNEQKKQKKRNDDLVEALSRGDISHDDDDYMAAITAAGQNVAAIYSNSVLGFNGSPLSARSPESAKKESRSATTTRKRKREGGSISTLNAADSVEGSLETSAAPKKLKLVTTRPSSHDAPEPITATTTTTQVPLAPEGPGTPSANRLLDSGSGLATAASSRPSRTPRAATPLPKTEEEDLANLSPHQPHAQSASPYGAPNTVPARARTSRGATNITLKLTQKAASAEPPHQRASRRRASETALLHQQQQEQQLQQQQHQQQSESKMSAPTAASSRGKRSAPGMTVGGEEGGAKLSLTRRKNDPAKKKGGSAAGVAEDIDPNEPLYCLCNNVSWGTMVACENPSCPLEWYHLQCVGLEQPPGKRQRWWCPTCRKKLGIGQFGEKKK